MSALMHASLKRRGKLIAVICLLGALALGLAACRGFFGQPPIAMLVPDTGEDQEVPVVVTFDFGGSNDPDGTIASFELDYGDGSTPDTGTDVSIALDHEYKTAGTFVVLLTIVDNDGRIGMANEVITIGPVMITFTAKRTLDFDIYRMQSDGSGQGAVYNGAYDEIFPDLVRGTRDLIAFAAEDGTSWNIWTMTVSGGSRSQLTTQTESNRIQPTWSADASTIAYASNAAQTPSETTWEIYTMTAGGTTQTQLTSQTPSWAIAPAYSPVNDDLLFVSNSDGSGGAANGGSAIWLWDDSLGDAVPLKDGPGRDGDASPIIGPFAVPLDLPLGAGISKPMWSPDGSKIVYATERTAGGIIDINVMDSDGTNVQTLEEYAQDLGSTATNITTDDHEFCPFWLEDESGVIFVREDVGGNYQIHKLDFSSGLVTVLTEVGNNVSPASKR